MRLSIAIGHGECVSCGAKLAVIENTLARVIHEDARGDALRTVEAVGDGENLVAANEDGTFQCPCCAKPGRLRALTAD